jgi:hypothetical protein
MSYSGVGNRISEHILSGNMPRKAKFDLSPLERRGLYQCLMEEYYGEQEIGTPGILQQFLFGRSCVEQSGASGEPAGPTPARVGH